MRLGVPPESGNAPVQSLLSKTSAFLQILHLLCRSGRETFRVGTEPPEAGPAVGLHWGVPSLLEAWAEAGDWLSRMWSVMQSPFSLLHTQISPTCWFVFDKGGSLSPAAFPLARLAQQLAGICSSSSFARFSAAEIPSPELKLPAAQPTRVPLQGGFAEMGAVLPCLPQLPVSWVMPCWGITSPGPAALL